MAESIMPLAGQLIKNGFRFRYLRLSGKCRSPEPVSLEVTHRCIAKCIMCNIWRIPRDTPSLSAKAWLSLLSSDLFTDLVELDITGGEPFLRTDLAELLIAVCELKKRHLASLKSIAVTTNGFLTRPRFGRNAVPFCMQPGPQEWIWSWSVPWTPWVICMMRSEIIRAAGAGSIKPFKA